jgi:hypothetical protein
MASSLAVFSPARRDKTRLCFFKSETFSQALGTPRKRGDWFTQQRALRAPPTYRAVRYVFLKVAAFSRCVIARTPR